MYVYVYRSYIYHIFQLFPEFFPRILFFKKHFSPFFRAAKTSSRRRFQAHPPTSRRPEMSNLVTLGSTQFCCVCNKPLDPGVNICADAHGLDDCFSETKLSTAINAKMTV